MANQNNTTSVTFKAFNQDFNRAMKEMKDESSRARREFQLQDEQLKATGTASDRLAAKVEYLRNAQRIAADQVREAEKQLRKVKETYGENSVEAERMARTVLDARIAYQRVTNQVRDTETALANLQHQTSASAQALQRLKQEEAALSQETRRMNAEFDLQRASMDSNATQTQRMQLRLSQLAQQQQHAALQTQNMAQQLDAARTQYGQSSTQAQQLEMRLLQLQTAEQRVANEINSTRTAFNNQEQAMRQLGTLLVATGNELDDFANTLGPELTSAIRNGTASTRQLESVLQRVGREALGTETDFNRMRSALVSLDSGASIDQIRRELQRLASEAGEAEQAVDDLGGSLEQAAGALAAGGGLAGVIQTALDKASLDTKIDISMEVPQSSIASVKQAVNTVTAYGVDAEEALEGVRRQWALNKDASDATNAAVVRMAGTIAAAFAGVDFNELIQEANEIAATLGITNEEAMGLVNTLLKTGFPPEQLDIISEYGDQLIQAGFTAKEVQAIMAAGVDTKSWNKLLFPYMVTCNAKLL
ncbi:MAG: hypothetical protein ACI35R_13050 [Bacillus sp. (in: firmicutes)]